MNTIDLARTVLFFPGNRPDRVDKAIQTAADMVAIDLEDAVPLAEKTQARVAVKEKVKQHASRAQMVHALGIAGSQAAGLLEFLSDGSYTKRFHAGWAAHSGLIAALLARDGFTGPATVIEGKFGFLKAYSPASEPAKIFTGWCAPYEVMRTSIKPHACCRYKQGPIDCILKLVRDNGLTAEAIEKVTVSILKAGFALVAEPRELKSRPQTIVDAQFSMPFGGAVAILKGNAFIDEYCIENIQSPGVKQLMQRFECIHDPEIEPEFPRRWPAKVEILTKAGNRSPRAWTSRKATRKTRCRGTS